MSRKKQIDVHYSLQFDENNHVKVVHTQGCTSHQGAGWQCWSWRVCPDNVLCPAFVQHMLSIWPDYVLVQFLTWIYPPNPTYVLTKSSIYPWHPTFVLSLSSDLVQIHQNIWRQYLVKNWTWQFLHLPSSCPAPGHKLDIIWTHKN